LVVFSQTERCEHVLKNGDEVPKGYYFGDHFTPFAPVPYYDFGVPDTSKISIIVYNSVGLSVFNSSCRLAGGNYIFDWGFLLSTESDVSQINVVSDLDSYYKPAEMHFEGSKKFSIIK
jgi:hypothetical protein